MEVSAWVLQWVRDWLYVFRSEPSSAWKSNWMRICKNPLRNSFITVFTLLHVVDQQYLDDGIPMWRPVSMALVYLRVRLGAGILL